jgi:hypothetical protein
MQFSPHSPIKKDIPMFDELVKSPYAALRFIPALLNGVRSSSNSECEAVGSQLEG